ncbi:MAG: hypothetical protein HYT61_03480 [Candidatus Yanofskybacteria bacterium]|nr:hypothetical protein [Candidatus Yanofskybacteria bacterium]
MILSFLTYKPVLVGLHLAFAIAGIDAFLWYLGELVQLQFGQSQTGAGQAGKSQNHARIKWASIIGVIGFALTWLLGGYYYVVNYGKMVKPVILKGTAPWAHAIAMEAKEHIFLFILPLAITAMILAFVDKEEFEKFKLRKTAMLLAGFIAFLGLAIGAMGFIISAAVRWG